MKVFEMIIEDGYNVYKHTGVYENKKDAETTANGNGELVRIKDLTENSKVDLIKVEQTLRENSYSAIEVELIIFTLQDKKENFHRL